MNRYFQDIKAFVRDHKKAVKLTSIILGGIIVLGLLALFIYNSIPTPAPKVTYKYSPVNACDLLTMPEAHTLLGEKVIGSPVNAPSVSGDIATSSCSYTDENTDQSQMKVAALAVLSAVDDAGVQTVKNEFSTKKSADAVTVPNLGEDAYFDQSLGQLNIFTGTAMLRISYGVGATPQNNTLDDAVTVGHSVLGNLAKK